MPAYAKDGGRLLRRERGQVHVAVRDVRLQRAATLDDGVDVADLLRADGLTATEEKKIATLVKKAVHTALEADCPPTATT